MKTENLRELDAWIAVELFGWKKTGVKCHRLDNRTIGGFLYSPDGFDGDLNQASYVPHYTTTDPAAAMQVLEKCAEKLGSFDVCIWKGNTKSLWFVGERKKALDVTNYEKAETLPLAICKFAKALYSK